MSTPNTRVGDYDLDECLRRDDVSETWRAHHFRNPTQPLVMKFATNPDYIEALRNEPLLPACPSHPRILLDREANLEADPPYLIREFASRTLRDVIAANPQGLAESQVRSILADVLDGLAFAHSQGLVHGAIAPSNILIDDRSNQASLADFGLAARHTLVKTATQCRAPHWSRDPLVHGGLAAAHLLHLATEILTKEGDFSPAADVYAVGVVLFQLLTGRFPKSALDFSCGCCGRTYLLSGWLPGELDLPSHARRDRESQQAGDGSTNTVPGSAAEQPTSDSWNRWDALYYWATRPLKNRYPDASAMQQAWRSEPCPIPVRVGFCRELPSGKPLHRFEGLTGGSLAGIFSPDGRYVLAGSKNGVIGVWEVCTGSLVQQLEGHQGPVNSVAVSWDGRWILTGSDDGTVRLWLAATGELTRTFSPHAGAVSFVAFVLEGKRAISCAGEDMITSWDTETGEVVPGMCLKHSEMRSVAISPAGLVFFVDSDDLSVRIWDLVRGVELKRFVDFHPENDSVALSPDGRHVLSEIHDSRVCRLWDAVTGEELARLQGHQISAEISGFSADGRFVLTFEGGCGASPMSSAYVWDVASAALLRRFAEPAFGFTFAVLSPDNRHLLTGAVKGTPCLWETGLRPEDRQDSNSTTMPVPNE